nr:DUF305 domain-containing protein [Ochrobactrum sp. CM-21-5]
MTSLWHNMQHLKTLAAYLVCALSGAAVMAVILAVLLPAVDVKSPSRLRQLVSNVMSVCNIGIESFGDEAAYLSAMNNSMEQMMYDMVVPPTGDLDRDFVQMMTPHHQGAINMAQIYLRFGGNEQLKRIAQEVIIDQLQEMNVMRLAIGDEPLSPALAPTQAGNY